jgi:hypothetical protein
MKTNIGSFDIGARFIAGCIVLFLGVSHIGWWGLLGFVPWVTAFFAFCPLYRLLHIDTAAWEARWEKRHHHDHPGDAHPSH